MRRVLVFGLLTALTVACATRSTSGAKDDPSRPTWTSKPLFVVTSTTPDRVQIAAVGTETILDPCGASALLVAAARNRALAGLAKHFDLAPDSEAAIAMLRGASVKTGWFDGTTIYALATIERPAADAKSLEASAVSGGTAIAHVEDQVKDAARAKADQCSCGDGPRCKNDFACEAKQGVKRCVCRGKSCPCEVRGCKVGEVCGDGRCY